MKQMNRIQNFVQHMKNERPQCYFEIRSHGDRRRNEKTQNEPNMSTVVMNR
jgi:hypothetical protein